MPEIKIGLETHVQLDTETKLFCGCPNEQAEEPNVNTCPTCLGHPGSKPRTNEAVIDAGIQAGLALDCEIAEKVVFSRKTYFYPDMNKNFQITQYEEPVASDGSLALGEKQIGIKRAHIEEDPAKLEHQGGKMESAEYTLVDYNRAGTPLLEIVTEPDIETPEEAREFLQRLIRIMEYLGIYDRDEGSVRSDANISMEGGNRVEVKNITGTRGIQKALEHEIERQEKLVNRGEEVKRETRNYDSEDEVTRSLRTKEEEQEYGYIFEPDLVKINVSEEEVEEAQDSLPELPEEKRHRFLEDYSIEEELADSLVTDPELADAFEESAEIIGGDLAASWFSGPIKKTLNYHELTYSESPLSGEWIVEVLEKLDSGVLSDRAAEKVIREMVEEPREPENIIEEEGLEKAESSEVEQYVEGAVEENPEAVLDYESGEEDALNFLVGQVMEKSGGSADPKEVRELLEDRL
ncbi:MAG: Asp-tRNA(Asn)/Glu-tRNA(Gln) amidotransferase subunit GatB [Candidatus Nanohaloarchaeota archaeon QJJ-7]|nr:Asp-tRNA(Asn)/Glu-tRNA(Gln) amidotransferase subunit GatB [Candidatus Nanohaloarchaeota archaeon QJJ-7]